MERKPMLLVMCGIQGSGKSTIAKELKEAQDKIGIRKTIILSSDEYRKENPSWDNNEVFTQLYKDMNTNLKKDIDVILDATNTSFKSREQIFKNLKVDCQKVCHIINVPYTICIERVKQRNENKDSHNVPLNIVEKYYHSFEIPFREEGWDYITFQNPVQPTMDEILFDKQYVSNKNKVQQEVFSYMKGFNQKCKYHIESLDTHCLNLTTYISRRNPDRALAEGALFHDFGKIKTQKPKIKEPDEMCYYNHENVGAYDLMCIYNLFEEPLESLFYINYHMKGFDINKLERSYNKYKKRFGEYKFNNLLLFNEADIASAVRREDV